MQQQLKKLLRRLYKTLKQINVKSLLFSLVIIAILICINLFHFGNFNEFSKTFFEHAWIEIASGVIVYLLLEIKIKEYGDVPSEDGQKDYDEILNGISKSKNTVRILDNDFASFFEGDKKRISEVKKTELKEVLLKCLNSLDKKQKIEILLLHPNTLAAQQRHDDLETQNFDLFIRMNEGLQFLYDFIDETRRNILEKIVQLEDGKSNIIEHPETIVGKISRKILPQVSVHNKDKIDFKEIYDLVSSELRRLIEVRLFKTSYSVVFVSWDEKINFSLLPPDKFSDSETFKTLQHTPLAKYFHDNFEEIWSQSDKTVKLEDYKQVIIHDCNGNRICESIPWGYDAYNYNLPVFIYIKETSRTIFDEAQKRNKAAATKRKESNQKRELIYFQVIHDKEMQWATIEKIARENINETPAKGNPLTIYEFAKEQIKKKSNFSVENEEPIYLIKYTQRYKIALHDDGYVKKHLEQRGYCYTPHSKYEVFLGLHLKDMLSALYDFFITGYDAFLNNNSYKEKPYQRILLHYTCELKTNGEVDIEVCKDSEVDLFPSVIGEMPKMKQHDIESNEMLNKFIKRTIAADICRIFGQKYRANKDGEFKTAGVGRYRVRIVLIKARVEKGISVPDWHEDGFVENTALYTVLHFAGKVNVIGGMPFIWFNDNKQSERNYNFSSTLDSLYFKKEHEIQGKNVSIRVDSSGTHFFPYKNIRYGYRNLVAVEFFNI